jgi:hypothetical protein
MEMKSIQMLVAAPLVALSSCAGVPQASTASTSIASAGAQYCKRDRLGEQGDKLVCTWSASIAEACENTYASEVPKSAVVSGPTAAGRCGNGQWLVTIATK